MNGAQWGAWGWLPGAGRLHPVVNWSFLFRYRSKETPVIKVCTTLPDGPEVCTTIDLAHDAASRAYATTVGDGTNTSYTLTHRLDSLDVLPVVRDIATGALTVATPTVTAVDADTVRLDFPAAPTQGQFQVTLLAVTPSV